MMSKLTFSIVLFLGWYLGKGMDSQAISLTRYIDTSCQGLDAQHSKICYDRQWKLILFRDILAWTPYEKTPHN
jgi:hypothetical protein